MDNTAELSATAEAAPELPKEDLEEVRNMLFQSTNRITVNVCLDSRHSEVSD